jgi:hypothetical protein
MADVVQDWRTDPIGLFNTARSYWRSAEHLRVAAIKVTHREAPITFLYCHAMELYLKASLRGFGRTVADLKRIGHRVVDLAEAAKDAGLVLDAESAEILSHIEENDIAIEARYIVTGFKQAPTLEALSATSERLDGVVCSALAGRGFAVRPQAFDATTPLGSEDESVEEYIHYMTTKDREIIGYLLHNNQRMFTCEPDGGHANLLLSKGFVQVAARPGQQVAYMDVPFEVPRKVWDALMKHKDEFPAPDEDDPYPWRVSWMDR